MIIIKIIILYFIQIRHPDDFPSKGLRLAWDNGFNYYHDQPGQILLYWYGQLVCTPALGGLFVVVCVYPSEVMTHTSRRTTQHCSTHERMTDHETRQSGLICIMPDGAIHYKVYLLKLTMAVDDFVSMIIKGAF